MSVEETSVSLCGLGLSTYHHMLRRAFAEIGAIEELVDLSTTLGADGVLGLVGSDGDTVTFGWSSAAGECTMLAAYGVHLVGCYELRHSRFGKLPDGAFAVVRGRLAEANADGGLLLQAIRSSESHSLSLGEMNEAEKATSEALQRGRCLCFVCRDQVTTVDEAEEIARNFDPVRAAKCLVANDALVRAAIEFSPPKGRYPYHLLGALLLSPTAVSAAAEYRHHTSQAPRLRALWLLLRNARVRQEDSEALFQEAFAERGTAANLMVVDALRKFPREIHLRWGAQAALLLTTAKNTSLVDGLMGLSWDFDDPKVVSTLQEALGRWEKDVRVNSAVSWLRHRLNGRQ